MARKNQHVRFQEGATSAAERLLRFPHLLGGTRAFREQTAEQKLAFLAKKRGPKRQSSARSLSFEPPQPLRREPFHIRVRPHKQPRRHVELVRLEVRFPSGNIQHLDCPPSFDERDRSSLSFGPFQSDAAGELYVSARIYYADGAVESDALLSLLLSANPDQLVVSPRVWLVSGRAGRVEYDWDHEEFHCRAYGTLTNGSKATRTYRRCEVRVTDGGVGGTLIDSFSFAVGPLTLKPGEAAHRSIDTWYGKGGSVWDKFNARWDLTVQFTYVADGDIRVSDSAAYRPMSTIPINAIKTTDFTSSQTSAEHNAVAIATDILEDRDVTLYAPNWRILSNQADKNRFGTITIGWSGGDYDFGEAGDMYDQISGPDQDRLDLFLPLGFDYRSGVPADKRNVGGFSTVDGPFPKDDDPRRSGSLVLVDENDQQFFGVAIAHELCHYLGLDHVDSTDNLMEAHGGTTGHELTWDQWDKIRQHGMMKWLAPDI